MPNLDPNVLFPVGLSVLFIVWSFTIVQAYKACRVKDQISRRKASR